VSSAVWISLFLNSFRSASKKSGCSSGSPPERVTPPCDSSKKTVSFSVSVSISLMVTVFPAIERASVGHFWVQMPHELHSCLSTRILSETSERAFLLQLSRHSPHLVHLLSLRISSGLGFWLSGL